MLGMHSMVIYFIYAVDVMLTCAPAGHHWTMPGTDCGTTSHSQLLPIDCDNTSYHKQRIPCQLTTCVAGALARSCFTLQHQVYVALRAGVGAQRCCHRLEALPGCLHQHHLRCGPSATLHSSAICTHTLSDCKSYAHPGTLATEEHCIVQ
jgi:hypothetical protein